MPIEVIKRYTRDQIKSQPLKLFIFGDNCVREGFGGQAKEARGEPNSAGIRTKRAPTYKPQDFFNDAHLALSMQWIIEDLARVVEHLQEGGVVVWPADGIGTGIADLHKNAPVTLAFIDAITAYLKKTYGVVQHDD